MLALYSLFMATDPGGQRELLRDAKERAAAAKIDPWFMTFLAQAIAAE